MRTNLMQQASDRYSSVIHRHRDSSIEAHDRFLSFVRVYLRPHLPPPDARVLDLGCGGGNLLRALEKLGYHAALGIDSSREQVQEALSQGRNVRHADIFDFLRATTDVFDAITLIDVAEHMDKAQLATLLRSCHERLVPGGVVIAHTTNAWSPFARYYFSGDVTHQQCYSPKMLTDIALLCGFEAGRALPAVPEHDWRRAGSVAVRARRIAQSIAWRLVSRAYALAEFVAIGLWHGLYTANLVFVCRKGA